MAAVVLLLAVTGPAIGGMAEALVENLRPTGDGVRFQTASVEAELGFQPTELSLPSPERARLVVRLGPLDAVGFAGDQASGRFGGVGRGSLRRSPYIGLAGRGDGFFLRHDFGSAALAATFLQGRDGGIAAGEAAVDVDRLRIVMQGGVLREDDSALDGRAEGTAKTAFAGMMIGVAPIRRLDVSMGWHEGRTRVERAGPLPSRSLGLAASIREPMFAGDKFSFGLDQDVAETGDFAPTLSGSYSLPLPVGRVLANGRHVSEEETRLRLSYALEW
ncbi:hypothetical protein [Ferruginivarius sediminum]|uniref:Uncharacterized protein n=1 Tax=Ferruginivarius sediminum TaxID=2661937 RepID=A0A369THL8_9PROT|nr:hypothetical protein [Ferruginivarius sediminum]RDD63885.1 hypothetical protein DRB17_01610 [Ferruginivarius sediminum]